MTLRQIGFIVENRALLTMMDDTLRFAGRLQFACQQLRMVHRTEVLTPEQRTLWSASSNSLQDIKLTGREQDVNRRHRGTAVESCLSSILDIVLEEAVPIKRTHSVELRKIRRGPTSLQLADNYDSLEAHWYQFLHYCMNIARYVDELAVVHVAVRHQ